MVRLLPPIKDCMLESLVRPAFCPFNARPAADANPHISTCSPTWRQCRAGHSPQQSQTFWRHSKKLTASEWLASLAPGSKSQETSAEVSWSHWLCPAPLALTYGRGRALSGGPGGLETPFLGALAAPGVSRSRLRTYPWETICCCLGRAPSSSLGFPTDHEIHHTDLD